MNLKHKNNFKTNILQAIFAVFLLSIASSCVTGDPYLYDRTGFENGTRPIVKPDPNGINRLPPDYARQSYAPQPYQPVKRPQYQNPQPQQYAAPPRQQQYAPNQQPQNGSRYYNNPYIDVPQQNYNPYYDSEQSYYPPNYYGNEW